MATAIAQMTSLYLKQNDLQAALDLAQQGKSLCKAYPAIVESLTLTELIALERSPNPLSRGRTAFEAAIKSYPKNDDIKRTYAALLIAEGEEKDRAKGYRMFQELQARYPDDYEANAYMATFFIEKANAKREKLDPMLGDKQYKEIEDAVIAELEKAYPFVKKAYEKQPEKKWLKQLVSISTYVPAFQGEKGKWENALNP